MDTRLELAGGEIEISSDEINLMPNSNREGLNSISDGISSGSDMIISGVGAVIDPGVNVTVLDGFVFLNGEMLKVDAQVVLRTAGTDFYQFTKVTTNPAAGSRNFRDGSTKNVYEENRAVPTNVAAITGLSVSGNTMLDVMKSLIQIQSDWDQADTGAPDYINNKPNVLNVLLQGKVNGIEVGTGGGADSPGEGDITTVTLLNDESSEIRIRVNFASIGTTDYHPILTLESKDPDWDKDNDVFCMCKNLTATSFEVLFKEVESNIENLTLLITVLPF